MERDCGRETASPASGNPILKIDDRPAPVVPHPHLALSCFPDWRVRPLEHARAVR